MPRNIRVDLQGEIFHIINRANARLQIFNTDEKKRGQEPLIPTENLF